MNSGMYGWVQPVEFVAFETVDRKKLLNSAVGHLTINSGSWLGSGWQWAAGFWVFPTESLSVGFTCLYTSYKYHVQYVRLFKNNCFVC